MELLPGEVEQRRERAALDGLVGELVLTTQRLVFEIERRPRGWFRRRQTTVVFEHPRDAIRTLLAEDATLRIVLAEGAELAVTLITPTGPWIAAFDPRDRGRERGYQLERYGAPRDLALGEVTAYVRDGERLVPELLVGWSEIFRGAGTIIRSPVIETLDGASDAPIRCEDVVEIRHYADGRGDGPPWVCVVRLRDGRWAYVAHVVQITGEVYSTIIVAPSLSTLWWSAVTDADRDRFFEQMSDEEIEEELVQLDAIMQRTSDAKERERAERRALATHRKRQSASTS